MSTGVTGLHTFPALCLNLIQDVPGKLENHGIDVVLDEQHGVMLLFLSKACVNGCNLCREIVSLPVTRVNFLRDDVVTKSGHVVDAA